jgi:hypothetical protein
VKQATAGFPLERRRGSTVPPAPPLLHVHSNGRVLGFQAQGAVFKLRLPLTRDPVIRITLSLDQRTNGLQGVSRDPSGEGYASLLF